MQKTFTLLLFAIFFPLQVWAGVGDSDNRYYVTDEMWATEPYKKFVHLISYIVGTDYVNTCTAQYVAPNLILSAGHCVIKNDKDDNVIVYKARNYKSESNTGKTNTEFVQQSFFRVKLLHYEFASVGSNDWALFLVENPEFYSDSYFNIEVPDETQNFVPVLNVGYGTLRIMKDEEIEKIKKFIKQINAKYLFKYSFQLNLNKAIHGATLDQIIQEIETSKLDIKPLEEPFPIKLKASRCHLVFKDCSKNDSDCNTFQGKLSRSKNYPYIIATTCDEMQGNSGGGYIGNDGSGPLYAVVSYGSNLAAAEFNDKKAYSYASSALQFKDKIVDLASKAQNHDINVTVPDITPDVKADDNNVVYAIQQNIEGLKQRNNVLENMQLPADNEEITNDTVLQVANAMAEHQANQEKIEKLQRAYDEAKANEQSLANRTLTAVTTAATGIGGMELARGLAEQKADKEAEQDMAAYIATFRCTYGDGHQVKAGPEEIELPGGNDATMMSLRNEYFSLASDLKERKEALGLTPGIESETILDKSEMGLYDDENVGITDGAYASIYRATVLESEEDQAKIDEERKASKNRVIGGAVAAGVGVVGGIVGNSLINGKLGEKIKENKENRNAKSSAALDRKENIKLLTDKVKKYYAEKYGTSD